MQHHHHLRHHHSSQCSLTTTTNTTSNLSHKPSSPLLLSSPLPHLSPLQHPPILLPSSSLSLSKSKPISPIQSKPTNPHMGLAKTHFLILLLHRIVLLRLLSGSFLPKDRFFINCGGDANVSLGDGRVFEPDGAGDSSSFSFSPITHEVVRANSSDLYGSARVFTEAVEYRFRIGQMGRHFLRLHFYPMNDELKSAVFSVVANGFTLLHRFSGSKFSISSSAHFKEYAMVLSLDPKPLTLRISPSNGSIAFISAIEVISTPQGLFPASAAAVPTGPDVEISSHLALETVYRINAGGPAIDSKNDTFWRIWQTDMPFLINSASVHTVSTNPDTIKFPPGVPPYTAPKLVYATVQEMADANVGNQEFNISWVFKVDSDSRYLVRLHFCNFINTSANNLMFNVYISNQSALSLFDISRKTELSTAYFVDFVVSVQMGSDKILIQVGPPQMTNVPPNAILNGIEIMKLSNPEHHFDAFHSMNDLNAREPKDNKKLAFVITSIVMGVTLLCSIVAVLVLCFRHQKKANTPALSLLPSSVCHTQTGFSETKVSARSYPSSGPFLSLGQLLAFPDILQATKNFDESLVIGVGGFGKVYKGVLENGVVVAVKRGNPQSQQGLVEFRTEIEMLSKLRHRHLVSLIGYCHEPNEMVLVYEFMAGGPLRRHLYDSDLPTLAWKQRLEICIGAAKGLHYLHTGAAETIIHRDVKTTNILLDENLTAKVADFGLSKSGPALDQTHVSTAVKGSFGYLDPEYYRRQRLTDKSDVYSFGVVLLEVLCARPAINPSLPRDQVNIVEWALNWQKRGQLKRIVDPNLVGTVSINSLRKFGETAEKCLAEYGIERPTMGDVLWNLEYALQLQESFTGAVDDGSSTQFIQGLPEWIPQMEIIDHDTFSAVSGGTDATTTRVFSQLIDPRGR